MGIRDLLFIGLVIGGSAALSASLLPPRTPKVTARPAGVPAPGVADEPVVAEVNALFRAEWSDAGLTPAPRAPELAVVRRLALALTGTVPSLEELRRFEAAPEGRRVGLWLDATLADRRSADYLAERLARACVGTEGGPFLVYRRRRLVTWLSDAIAQNRPYDQVVRDLIAGQGLWTDQPETNFLTVAYDPEKKVMNPERLAARVARVFLGVRIDCAQCHDHPFQAWTRRDFQGLAAFFGQAHTGFSGVYDGGGEYQMTDRATNKPVTVAPRVPFAVGLLPDDGTRRMRLARWVTDPKNPQMSRATVNRVWALLFGKALVEPVDDLSAVETVPPVLDRLAADFVVHGYDLRRLIRVIAATEVFRLDSATGDGPTEAQEAAWAAFPMTRLRPEQVAASLFQSAALETIDADSPILVRLARWGEAGKFVVRYGDSGEDEFDGRSGTIPQRLLMMNGELVGERTKPSPFNAATRIGWLAPTGRAAVETAYLAVLTRRPSPQELAHFEARLQGTARDERSRRMTDLYWTLVNSTEFSWNH